MIKENNNSDMDPSLLPALAKAAPGFWKTLYKDLGQPAVQVLGKTLAKAIDFCSIPIYALGYASDAFKLNMEHRLSQYSKKLEGIPEEKLYSVDPQIGAPIIEHLSYTTNDEIADLFTTLLANASNVETLDKAHPSFAHIISRLSVDEARIIKYLSDKTSVEYCIFMADLQGDFDAGFNTIINRATLLPFNIDLTFPDNTSAYLSNLESLGILSDKEGMYKTDDSAYNEILAKYNHEELRNEYKNKGYRDVSVEKSFYEVTPFGRLFIDACIKS